MDWRTLEARLALDPDLSARGRRLLALETVLDNRQYDALPYPFACERSPAGEYVPLSERRPSVRTGLCRVVVEDSVSLLFSESHFPKINAKSGGTRALFRELVGITALNETMLHAAIRGSVGSVAIHFRVLDGRPFFDVLSTAFLEPEWDRRDPRRLIRVTERYKASGAELRQLGYAVDPERTYWFRRMWDAEAETWFQPLPTDTDPAEQLPDPDRTTAHLLGFVPIVWIRNLPGQRYGDIDGASTFEPAIDTVIEADYLLSQAGRGLKYGSDPTLVLKDGGRGVGGDRIGGAATALVLPPEGDAKLLEINGSAAASVLAHVRELRALALETMHGNRSHADRLGGPQSGRALELMSQGLIWLADRLRVSYGETALIALLRMVARATNVLPGGIRLGRIVYEDVDPTGISLQWPPWFAPGAGERQAQAAALATLVGSDIISRDMAQAVAAQDYELDTLAS